MLMRLVLRLESLLQNLKASAKLEVKTLFSRTRKIMALWKRRPLRAVGQGTREKVAVEPEAHICKRLFFIALQD